MAALCALAMVAAVQALTPSAAAAQTDGSSATPERRPLLHLENSRGVPLYTLSQAEADNAVARHGFTRRPHRHGYLWNRGNFDHSTPIYRLTKVGGNGWLYVSSPAELAQVLMNPIFRMEGVAGYASATHRDGTVMLSRYSKPDVGWKLSLPAPYGNPQALIDDGYRWDGPLGYVYPR